MQADSEHLIGIVEKVLHQALQTGSITSAARAMKHEIVSHPANKK